MTITTTRSAMLADQQETILDVLHERGRPWKTTRAIADRVPWSALTIIARLRSYEAAGLVESRRAGHEVEWRLL